MIASGRADRRATEDAYALTMAPLFRRMRRALPILVIATLITIAAPVIAQPVRADGATEILDRSDTGGAPITVGLTDASLRLPIPAGYCAVERAAPGMTASYDALEAAFGSGTCLLAWYVDCETLASVRDEAAPVSQLFGHYGVYITPINGEGMVQRFTGMTRDEFIRQIAESLPPFDRDLLSITVGKSHVTGDVSAGLRLATREIGLLGFDAQAYYLATAVELTLGGRREALAGVAATTLVHQVAVSTIVYGGLEGTGTLAMLEQQARAVTMALIDANPGGDDGSRRLSFDANRLLLIGFAVGLLFIAIGVVNLAWKWWCRRYGLQP